MKTIYNILFILLTPAILLAGNGKKKGKFSKEKTYHKEYSVSSNATLNVTNSFGNVVVSSWNENKIQIDVTVTASSNKEKLLEEQLNAIAVELSGNESLVEAFTKISKKNNWGRNKTQFDINYNIKIPITNNINIKNSFGDVHVDKLNGNTRFCISHGNINLGELKGQKNEFELSFCNASSIKSIPSITVSGSHSTIDIDNSEDITIKANHFKLNLENTNTLNFKGSFGKIYAQSIGHLTTKGSHMKMNIKTITNSINTNTGFSSIKIKDLKNSTKQVSIEAQFSQIIINYEPGLYKFNTYLKNCSFTNNAETIFKKELKDQNSTYTISTGNDNSETVMKLKNTFGSIKLLSN